VLISGAAPHLILTDFFYFKNSKSDLNIKKNKMRLILKIFLNKVLDAIKNEKAFDAIFLVNFFFDNSMLLN
jgi:hypothetical protein